MQIRLAKIEELEIIKKMYDLAKNYMDNNGNKNQWINNYPDIELLKKDIENKRLYICSENEERVAVFCFYVGIEPTYNEIYNGKWLNNKEYAIIHRIAVTKHQKGYATKCIQWCIKQYKNIKIDTHKDNIPMQKTILKNGFKYCGIIKKPDNSERLAYQISL